MSVAFLDALGYRTYRLCNRSLRSAGKMTAHTAMLAKLMKTIMKPYNFENSYPAKTLSFLGQFERVCDSNGESKGVAIWFLPFSTAESPAASLTICFTSTNNDDTPLQVRREIERQK